MRSNILSMFAAATDMEFDVNPVSSGILRYLYLRYILKYPFELSKSARLCRSMFVRVLAGA
jgi:hypothetical protein